MDPIPTEPMSSARKRPKPAVAIVAVAVPLLAIIIAAVVTTARSGDSAATATTISQSGDPAAAGKDGSAKGTDGATTETTTKGGGKAPGKGTTTSTTTTKPRTEDPQIPSTPINTGPEGERTSVTYPQPTVPASGCSRPSGTAVITLTAAPSPACLELGPDQPVIVRNRTGKEITFVAISVNEVIAAGSEMRVGTALSAFGEGQSTFWSPGNPKLSGIVRVG